MFSGARFLLDTPRVWPHACVPALVLVVLAAGLGWGAIALTRSTLEGWLGHPESDLGRAGASLLAFAGSVLAALLGLFLALVLTPPLSSPALERIVERWERQAGVPARAPLGIWREIGCGVRAQAVAAVFALPILALLWVLELVFSPAVFVTVPLRFVVTAFGIAWNLFDYPLTLRGVRMRDRMRLVARYKAAALGFGTGFALLFWIPCCGVLMLPVGVAGATRLVWRILESDETLLPWVSRPQDKSTAMPI